MDKTILSDKFAYTKEIVRRQENKLEKFMFVLSDKSHRMYLVYYAVYEDKKLIGSYHPFMSLPKTLSLKEPINIPSDVIEEAKELITKDLQKTTKNKLDNDMLSLFSKEDQTKILEKFKQSLKIGIHKSTSNNRNSQVKW